MTKRAIEFLKNYIISEVEEQEVQAEEDGTIQVEFYLKKFEFFVKANLDIYNFKYDSGDWYNPPSVEWEQKFENAFIEVSEDDKHFNIKTKLNELLS
jgi:hypothetical protein